MTMQDPSGPNVTVVAPGSAEDPFSANPGGATQSNGGASGSQPDNVNVQQNGQQNQQVTQAPNGAAVAAPAQTTAPAGTVPPELEATIQARIAAAHSGLDRKINTLQKQLQDKEAEVERVRQETERKLREAQSQGLPEEERKKLQAIWDIEDARREVERREKAVKGLALNVEGMRVLTKYEAFGITEDDILGFDGDFVGLEDHIKAIAFDRVNDPNYKPATGAKPGAASAGKPAGAGAAQDLGSSSPPAGSEGPKLLTTVGVDSMAANIKAMFADERPVVPWS